MTADEGSREPFREAQGFASGSAVVAVRRRWLALLESLASVFLFVVLVLWVLL